MGSGQLPTAWALIRGHQPIRADALLECAEICSAGDWTPRSLVELGMAVLLTEGGALAQ
jgi:hypothetical protein